MTAETHTQETPLRTPEAVSRPAGRLAHFPVALFSSVMGLGGTALAWRRAAHVWGMPEWPFLVFLLAALVAFVVVGSFYVVKWVRHGAAARAELRHPIRLAFVPTITVAILILATALSTVATEVATVLWWIGAVGHLTATVLVLSAWFGRADLLAGHITPAWFIPIVGNVVTPLAAPAVGSVEVGWFAFGVGMIFWLALLPLLLQRLLTHDQPLPEKLLPTLAIFIAPPAVAMLSWQSLTQASADPVSHVLYGSAMFFVLLVLAQVGRLRRIPFAVPYWAYTFPFAAATVAAIAMADAAGSTGYHVIAAVLLTMTTALVLVISTLTVRAASRGEICVPE